jgi:diketogulonate reductase-like aldo/keto reductase
MSPDLPRHPLNDGNSLPWLGFGTYGLTGEDGIAAIVSALEVGYRLLDTAVSYGNEEEVGEAVRRSGLARADVQVTTKLRGRDHAGELAAKSVEDSLRRLGLDYLDLCLIHWPNPSVGKYAEAWRALVDLKDRELVRSIGVSNFTQDHLRVIIDDTGVTPAVNQIEVHPYFPQQEMRAAHEELGILTESWSPLGKREAPFEQPPVVRAADAHGVTPAQVILRWHLQLGAVPLPKSATPERQRQNFDLLGFELDDREMADITALGRPDGRLFDGDPDVHEEM